MLGPTCLVHRHGGGGHSRRLIRRRLNGHRAPGLGLQRLCGRRLVRLLHGPRDEAARVHRQAVRDAALRSAPQLLLLSRRQRKAPAQGLWLVYHTGLLQGQ